MYVERLFATHLRINPARYLKSEIQNPKFETMCGFKHLSRQKQVMG